MSHSALTPSDKADAVDAVRGGLARPGLTMLAQFAASGAIQIGSKLLVVLSGVLLARVLGASGLGVYAFTLSSVTLGLLVCEFGMRSLHVREVAASLAQRRWGHLRSLLNYGPTIIFAAGVLVGAAAAIVIAVQPGLPASTRQTYLLACALLPCLALMRILISQIVGFGLVLQSQVLELLLYPGVVACGVAFVYLVQAGRLEPEVAMAFQVIATLVTAAVLLLLLERRKPVELKRLSGKVELPIWVRGALPFLLMDTALALHGQMDTQIIGWMGDDATVGNYRIALQLAGLAAIGLSIVVQFGAPRIAHLFAAGDMVSLRTYYVRLQALGAASAGLVVLTLVVFGRWIINKLFGAEYAGAYAPMVVLAFGFLGNAAFGPAGTLLLMTGDERRAGRWFWSTLVLNLALSPFLFHWFGAVGTAAATATAATFNHLLCWATAQRSTLRVPRLATGA
jgi:O-antigen/teichoic acid export membrane protein